MPLRRLFLLLILLISLAGCQPQAENPPLLPETEPVAALNPPRGGTATYTPFQPLLPSLTPPHTPSPVPTLTPISSQTPVPTQPPIITLLFTGVIVPARCVQAAIDERNDADYVYDEVRELISGADLAIGTLNTTLSDYPAHTGCVFTYLLVSDSRSAYAMERAGFDAMSVATNHIKNCGMSNCGDRAFLETLENLRLANILPVGAGENLAEAVQPLVVTVQGVRFGIVSLGEIESTTFAGEDTPGIAVLTEDSLRQAIEAAREVSDVVIAMPHWGPEESHVPNYNQRALAQVAVDAGADLVVGNHTHVVQAVQTIQGVDVFYGLGNFVFDQDWDLAHQQGVILVVSFQGTQYLGYELIPTHVDGDGTVHLAGPQEAAQILQYITDASALIK